MRWPLKGDFKPRSPDEHDLRSSVVLAKLEVATNTLAARVQKAEDLLSQMEETHRRSRPKEQG